MFQSPEKIVDLSNPIEEGIPVWPTFPSPRLEKTRWAARDGFTMEKLELFTHTGTHIDAPQHFVPEGKTLDDFPIDQYMGEGVALDITPKEPGDEITVEDIEQYEDDIEEGDVIMLHSNWDRFHGRTAEYLFEFPFLTAEAAEYIASLNPKAIGTESTSVAGWGDELPNHGPVTDIGADESHLPLLENEISIIEEIRNLDEVLDGEDTKRAFFVYTPLNLQNTGGSPVRAFAFL